MRGTCSSGPSRSNPGPKTGHGSIQGNACRMVKKLVMKLTNREWSLIPITSQEAQRSDSICSKLSISFEETTCLFVTAGLIKLRLNKLVYCHDGESLIKEHGPTFDFKIIKVGGRKSKATWHPIAVMRGKCTKGQEKPQFDKESPSPLSKNSGKSLLDVEEHKSLQTFIKPAYDKFPSLLSLFHKNNEESTTNNLSLVVSPASTAPTAPLTEISEVTNKSTNQQHFTFDKEDLSSPTDAAASATNHQSEEANLTVAGIKFTSSQNGLRTSFAGLNLIDDDGCPPHDTSLENNPRPAEDTRASIENNSCLTEDVIVDSNMGRPP